MSWSGPLTRPACASPRRSTLAPQGRGEGKEKLQPQYRLRDDVLLNLVRTAVDRDFAPVEVLRRERRRVVRADRRLVPAVVLRVAGLVRQCVRADRLHQQFRDALLDFRALDLEDG